MSDTKAFPTLDVVTVSTGTMLSDRGIAHGPQCECGCLTKPVRREEGTAS